MWPFLTLTLLLALVALHVWWRGRLRRLHAASAREIQELKGHQEQASSQFKAQQDALFDSMAEGLLLLDELGRIQLANRAFGELFGLDTDIRSRTILEALRSQE